MLEIKLTKKGYEPNHSISERLFDQCKNTIVKVVCEIPYYGTPQHLANDICDYMNTFMPDNCTIKTHCVATDTSTGVDSKGEFYVDLLAFQIFI